MSNYIIADPGDTIAAERRALALRVMKKARSLIRFKKRWVQGRETALHKDGLAYCAVGSIRAAATDLDAPFELRDSLIKLLNARGHDEFGRKNIMVINDDKTDRNRSHARVINLFDWLIQQLMPPAPASTTDDDVEALPVMTKQLEEICSE